MARLITSVAIVDAPGPLRTAMARGLWRDGRMTVTLFDDANAFATASERPADVALIAIELVEAITTLSPLRRAARCHRLVAWGRDPDPELALHAIRHGACGVLDKRTSMAGMLRALTAIGRGQSVFPRDLSGIIAGEVQRLHRRSEAQARIAPLSRREREVLALLKLGCRNAVVAEQLGISEPTAKRHVHNILAKLEVPSRAAAARVGIDAGDGLELRPTHAEAPVATRRPVA